MKFTIGFGQKINDIWAGLRKKHQLTQTEKAKTDTVVATYEIDDGLDSKYTPEPIDSASMGSTSGPASPLWRILEMRKMKIPGHEPMDSYYNAEELFVLQAKAMVDFEDHYTKTLSFMIYTPTYQQLSTEQLRYYFTWRTKVRKGLVKRSCLSCVYLYIYELINNIGVADPLDGFAKLVFIWQEYRKINDSLDYFLVAWLKDYYMCNDFVVSFKELVLKYGLEEFYPDMTPADRSKKMTFKQLSKISNYKVHNSKFLTNDKMPLFIKCLLCVVLNLQPLFDLYGLSLYEVIVGQVQLDSWYRPFRNAVYLPVAVKKKHVVISHCEAYECTNNNWSCEKPTNSTLSAASLVGYLMKHTEAALRVATGYRYKLSPALDLLIHELQENRHTPFTLVSVLQDEGFDNIIHEAVMACYSAFLEDAQVAVRDISVPTTKKYVDLIQIAPYAVFTQMRKIKPADTDEQFFKQAKLMENLTDDFPLPEVEDTHLALYGKMTNHQLRGYFSWRTQVKSGQYPPTNPANIRLYSYELIHSVGAVDSNDAISKMADILLHYGEPKSSTAHLVASLLKDYYLCQDCEESFVDIVKKYHLESSYPSMFLALGEADSWFAIYNQVSNYALEQSRFYTESIVPIMTECFNLVLKDMVAYFNEQGASFEKMMVAHASTNHWWQPFKDVPYFQSVSPTDKKVVLAPNESYEYKNHRWSALALPENNPVATQVTGYMIKRIEARLREITHFQYKLSPNVQKLIQSLPYRSANIDGAILKALKNPGFDETIDRAVANYCSVHLPPKGLKPETVQAPPVKITIDTTQLEAIRKSAAENQERLLVTPDEREEPTVTVETAPEPLDTLAPSGWLGLYTRMTATDKQALAIILDGENTMTKLQALSQDSGKLMVEVMIETINELALQCIGDNIMESSAGKVVIYDEYAEDLRQMMGRNT